MRVILSHAGGFLPFATERFAEAAALVRPNNSPAQTLEAFRRFYFDTALSSGPAALQSLKTFAGNGRILFGSDFPYAPAELGGKFTAKLDADTALTDRDRAAINHENAHGLFERLRKPASA